MKKFIVILSTLAFVLVGLSCSNQKDTHVSVVDRPDISQMNTHYIGNRAPLHPSYFIKLPVGSIQPKGWIEEYLLRAKNGMTGRLNEISKWLVKEGNAWLNEDGEGENGWEEVPYWLKGYISLAYLLNDPEMIAESEIWINGAINSQRPDGYFGPWIEKKGNPDLWGNMIMLWCLQTYYEHTHDNRVITLMTNYFKWQLNFPDERFLISYWENCRGGDNLHSIFWLYNITGESWLLDVAEKTHRCTSDWTQDTNFPNWHNVNIAQGFREPATYWALSQEHKDLKATYNNYSLIRRTFGQVPGGMYGSDENCRLGYIDPRQGTETCGFVEQMASDELLLRYTGDPMWADNCEDVAFNSFPAAIMSDFKGLRYFTSPNMVTSNEKNHAPGIQNRGPMLAMNPLSYRCCQHNHTQGWPYYAEHLWLATPDNGLAVALFNSCEVRANVGQGQEVKIIEKTNYPFEDKVVMTVQTENIVEFPIYIRVPQWSTKTFISVNGKKLIENPEPRSYVRIQRKWDNNDVIEINFPMELFVREWAVNQNSVSVDYGPLTFSLKIDEDYQKLDAVQASNKRGRWQENWDVSQWPAYALEAGSPWNYGLVLDKNHLSKSFKVIKKQWPDDNFPFTPQSVPLEIVAKGKRIPSWEIDEYDLTGVLPRYPVHTETATEDIELIPMGAARLRITSFPVIEN